MSLDRIPPWGYPARMAATPSKAKSSPRKKGAPAKRAKHAQEGGHARHLELLPLLNRVQGQLKGIQDMIVDERYCVDILTQFRAAMSALRGIEVRLFEEHLSHCVADALRSKDQKAIDRKIQELSMLLTRRTTL